MTPRRTYLPSINNLACSKACSIACSIEPVLENMNPSYLCPESLKHDKIKTMC